MHTTLDFTLPDAHHALDSHVDTMSTTEKTPAFYLFIFFNRKWNRIVRKLGQTQRTNHLTSPTERRVTLHSNQSANDHPPPRAREVHAGAP